MSYVHEGATDKALAEVEKMAAIDQTGKDLAALSGAQNQMGDILLEAGRIDEAAEKYKEQVVIIDKRGRARPGQGGDAPPGAVRRGARGAGPA